MSPRRDLHVPLPLDLDAVEVARLSLLAWIEPLAASERAINRIEVVLEELVSNVVRHGIDVGRLALRARAVENGVELAVEDDGAAFDPLDAPEPAPFASLESATLGRQGIPLIRRLSRSAAYVRGDGRNRTSAVLDLA